MIYDIEHKYLRGEMCIGAGSAASTRSVPPTASESIRPAVAAAFTAVATTTFAPAPPESSRRALTGSKATLPLEVAEEGVGGRVFGLVVDGLRSLNEAS